MAAPQPGASGSPVAALLPGKVSPIQQELEPPGKAVGDLPTIAGGDTPLASLSAEDALAFREIQRMRPDLMARAGAMTAEQLMAEVSRKLETIGDDRMPSPLPPGLRSAWSSESGKQSEPQP